MAIAWLLTFPINSIIASMASLENVAHLQPLHALILVAISTILTMLGVYSLLIKFDLSVPATMLTFGGFVMVSMALVILKHHRNQREFDSTHLIGEDKRH